MNGNNDYADDAWGKDSDNGAYAVAKHAEESTAWNDDGDAYGVNGANKILTNETTGSSSGSTSCFYSGATGSPSGFFSIEDNIN